MINIINSILEVMRKKMDISENLNIYKKCIIFVLN